MLRRALGGAVLALLLATSVGGPAASAQGDRALSIARRTMSPFCPGATVDGCTSPRAAEWRRDIRGWVDEGLSDAEIQSRLQARAPEFNLSGLPSEQDWTFPFSATLVASVILFFAARRLVRRRQESGESVANESAGESSEDELDARLDAELERFAEE